MLQEVVTDDRALWIGTAEASKNPGSCEVCYLIFFVPDLDLAVASCCADNLGAANKDVECLGLPRAARCRCIQPKLCLQEVVCLDEDVSFHQVNLNQIVRVRHVGLGGVVELGQGEVRPNAIRVRVLEPLSEVNTLGQVALFNQ